MRFRCVHCLGVKVAMWFSDISFTFMHIVLAILIACDTNQGVSFIMVGLSVWLSLIMFNGALFVLSRPLNSH